MLAQRRPASRTKSAVSSTAFLTCLGFDRVERSYQPRLIALSIVPGHLVEHLYFSCSARCPPICRNALTAFLDQELADHHTVFLFQRSAAIVPQQLNTLQTVALRNHAHALLKRENMVKPHGSLVPVSSTHRCAYTPGLSTWSSTRSLQRDYSLGDLISWRVSRLDAFSVSPFRT